jgi:hypothetical protein
MVVLFSVNIVSLLSNCSLPNVLLFVYFTFQNTVNTRQQAYRATIRSSERSDTKSLVTKNVWPVSLRRHNNFGCEKNVLLTLRSLYMASRLYYPTPPSLVVSCKLGFQTVDLKIFSLSNIALTILNKFFKWCFGNWPDTCSSASETPSFLPQLGVSTVRIVLRHKTLSTIGIQLCPFITNKSYCYMQIYTKQTCP